ncbi:hypothetical protein [Campylobacter jejuni]|uniref:hypothetical protein n=1 Tax=Campylobacter jejuni TaxID=197 RepID=UPI0009A8175C|nr:MULTISPECIES: hypothetical protein [Campylobacter]MCC2566387.1 hypothetical protein [Campylobacter coli]MCC2577071.1 hypothetical protein [Campylobacter coli]MCC3123476.1 hypothetical protein [Campylobacter jejuni]MCG4098989.1 hypothetical protein [Campylobacter coli]MCG4104257.1 hypothetical protein [Campylobacter coli]
MPEKGKTFAGEVREETVAWSKDTYQLLKQAEQGKVKSYVQDIALAVLPQPGYSFSDGHSVFKVLSIDELP